MRRNAFTLTELLVGMTVMLILAGVMTLNSSAVGRQTAKREAERVAAYIQDRMRRADMAHSVVWFTITTNEIKIGTGANPDPATETLTASDKCTYSPLKLVYPEDIAPNVQNYTKIPKQPYVKAGTGTGITLTVNGEDGRTCNVIIGR